MSVIGSNVLAGASGSAGAAGYTIERSLRFNDDDSAYLSRTPSSAGNRRTMTWSGWVKRSNGSQKGIFSSYAGTHPTTALIFNSNNEFWFFNYTASYDFQLKTSAQFRDFSAWFHFVVAVDTTQATASNRVKIYINGEQVTAFGTSTYPLQNFNLDWNSTTQHYIGRHTNTLDGYLADFHFVDGQALAPTDFGEYDDNNVWQPKAYSGTYGTNGFHLDFSDNTSTTTVAEDSSGNGNDWTANNFSVASGAGNDSLIDTPTNYTASSGNNGGNYATLNHLIEPNNYALSDGNLKVAGTGTAGYRTIYSTIGVSSGKWYFEAKITALGNWGFIGAANSLYRDSFIGNVSGAYGYEWYYGRTYSGNAVSNTGYGTYTTNDVIAVALDLDNGKIYWAKNGTWLGSSDPAAGTNPGYTGLTDGPYFFGVSTGTTTGGINTTWEVNFGQRPFAYTPPTGYVSLCTQNLTDPTIADGSTAMDIATWTGDATSNTSRTISLPGNLNPDLVWIKRRSTSFNHLLNDSVRGFAVNKGLNSNTSDSESNTNSDYTYGFVSGTADGEFTVASGIADSYANKLNETHVAWVWNAGANSNKTYTVTVVSDSGNKYRFDGHGTSAVTLDLEEGSTYVFDQSDSSNATHPLRFSTTSDGTHNSGTEYTTGVTTTGTPGQAGAKTTITVASGAPTLYYYCSAHSGMGGQADTNSTAGASNFDGSIQSNVRANASTGFSIVSWTCNGSTNQTIGHGLNATPEFMIFKNRDRATNWTVFHKDATTTTQKVFYLNSTGAVADYSGGSSTWWNALPTSSVFSVGDTSTAVNHTNGDKMITYCFAPVEGFSAFGGYTGNGSTDGPFIYAGFRPAFLMFKRTDSTGTWEMYDTARDAYNPYGLVLTADSSAAEVDVRSGYPADILSNGFKLRHTGAAVNANGGTYIYIAFAEHPFKTARAR